MNVWCSEMVKWILSDLKKTNAQNLNSENGSAYTHTIGTDRELFVEFLMVNNLIGMRYKWNPTYECTILMQQLKKYFDQLMRLYSSGLHTLNTLTRTETQTDQTQTLYISIGPYKRRTRTQLIENCRKCIAQHYDSIKNNLPHKHKCGICRISVIITVNHWPIQGVLYSFHTHIKTRPDNQ